MATATELVLGEELEDLRRNAERRGWTLEVLDTKTFILALPAKDGTWVQLLAECDDYPTSPPAWHFRNPQTGELEHPAGTPRGGGFFHSSGVICAPWNRLAYRSQWERGPHNDWTIGDWRANPSTGGAKTLSAMALRIYVELQSSYQGRQG